MVYFAQNFCEKVAKTENDFADERIVPVVIKGLGAITEHKVDLKAVVNGREEAITISEKYIPRLFSQVAHKAQPKDARGYTHWSLSSDGTLREQGRIVTGNAWMRFYTDIDAELTAEPIKMMIALRRIIKDDGRTVLFANYIQRDGHMQTI